MKKLFTLIIVCLTAISTWAYDVEVDGIYYNLNTTEKTAEVTYNGDAYSSVRTYSGSVTIPESIVSDGMTYSVTSIGREAFYGDRGLTSVTIPNSVTSIGDNAFNDCSGLTSVIIGNSVTSIGYDAFLFCKGLTSVVIPNSVTNIGSDAFYGCSGLTSVTIGNSVTSIRDNAFYGCSSLTSVTIPNSVTSIGNIAFSGCSGLTSVTIGNSVTSIGGNAFDGCTGLTSVTIPNSVTSIEYRAFYGCTGVKTISIGTGIKTIYSQAFASCKNVETVTCYAENVPTMKTNVFKDSPVSSATLKVPNASVDIYKAADQWKEFGTIVGKCATPTISLKDGKVVATSGTEGATCTVSYQLKGSDGTYTLEVTAYATADGYLQSETVTATYPLNVGVFGDINGDGTVNIVDVNSLVNKLLGK